MFLYFFRKLQSIFILCHQIFFCHRVPKTTRFKSAFPLCQNKTLRRNSWNNIKEQKYLTPFPLLFAASAPFSKPSEVPFPTLSITSLQTSNSQCNSPKTRINNDQYLHKKSAWTAKNNNTPCTHRRQQPMHIAASAVTIFDIDKTLKKIAVTPSSSIAFFYTSLLFLNYSEFPCFFCHCLSNKIHKSAPHGGCVMPHF